MRRRVGTIVIAILFLVAGARAFASTNGSLTISGSEQPGDSGVVTISFDGISETVHYGQYSSAASVASAFGAMFSRDFASKLCAHAVGSTILFTLKGEATFGPVTISGSTSSFQVDTSLWPGSLINPPVSLECDPDTVTAGNATSCTASVAVSATGTVSFSLDGAAPFATVSLSSGSASVSNILSGSSVGPHLIAAVYSGDASHSAGGADASVTVSAAPGSLTPATIYSYSITAYAPNGNINGYTDSVNGTWSGITYDSLSRLIGGQQVAGAATQYFCWVYDSFGNRTLQSSAPAAFQSGSPNCTPASGVSATTYATGYDVANHLTSTPFSYPAIDAAGNITSDDTNQYLYDDDGRICAVQGPPAIAGLPATMMQYIYDAEGNRVAKGIIGTFSCDTTSNGFTLTKSYVLDKDGHEVTEMGGDGQWVHTNVYVGGELLATYTDSGVHFHITDWLGNRRVQADYLGRVEETWQNLPFGEMVPNNIHAPLGATSEHFTGKEHDSESGNDYFGARYYASTAGRFMSPDPLLSSGRPENPQTWDRYTYALNNPLAVTDPTGLYNLRDDCAEGDDECHAKFDAAADKLKAGLAALQKAVNGLADGDQKTDLQHSLNAIGTENDGNNVDVGFHQLAPGVSGHTDVDPTSTDTNLRFSLTFDPAQMGAGIIKIATDAAHEGRHVADIENPLYNLEPSLTPFQLEYRGYQTSAWAASALGQPKLEYPGGVVWDKGWRAADRLTLMDKGITQEVKSIPGHPDTQPQQHNPWPY